MINRRQIAFLSFLSLALASCGGGGVDPGQATRPQTAATDGGLAKEKKMIALARGHSQQRRAEVIWDARLGAAARKRAADMGTRGYFSHTDPDGKGPNWHVSRTGYKLPLKWTAFDGANQIESILAGQADPDTAFKMWMDSKKHVSHILARNPFYMNQTRVGVGYAFVPNSPFKHYWVFLSAPPER